jgi:hypothetical protein
MRLTIELFYDSIKADFVVSPNCPLPLNVQRRVIAELKKAMAEEGRDLTEFLNLHTHNAYARELRQK